MSFPLRNNMSRCETGTFIVPIVALGTLGFAIGVTLLVAACAPWVTASCLNVAKWMAVSVAGLVVIKLLRDAYYSCYEGAENGYKEGLRRFALESALTISVPIVAGIIGVTATIIH